MAINELGLLERTADSGSGAGNVKGKPGIFHHIKILSKKKKKERKEACKDYLSHAKRPRSQN